MCGNFARRVGALAKIPAFGKITLIRNQVEINPFHFTKEVISLRGHPISLQIMPQAVT